VRIFGVYDYYYSSGGNGVGVMKEKIQSLIYWVLSFLFVAATMVAVLLQIAL
jgi:hypothetical protein